MDALRDEHLHQRHARTDACPCSRVTPAMVNYVSAADPLLFTKTLEFAGVFRDGDLATKPLSIEIRYSPLNAHPPTGIIRGTAADWPGLESFFHGRRSSLCESESVSSAEEREKICSKQVLLRKISMRTYPDDETETIQQILGHFEPLDIMTTATMDNAARATVR